MLTSQDPLSIAITNTRNTRAGIYIGRASNSEPGSPLQNPFPLSRGGGKKERSRVVQRFRQHLENAIAHVEAGIGAQKDLAICLELDRLVEAAKKGPLQLRCWCAPQECHGDVIKEVIEEAIATNRVFSPHPATATRAFYGTCWRCGEPKKLPGLDYFLCSASCGWLPTEKPIRAKTFHQKGASCQNKSKH